MKTDSNNDYDLGKIEEFLKTMSKKFGLEVCKFCGSANVVNTITTNENFEIGGIDYALTHFCKEERKVFKVRINVPDSVIFETMTTKNFTLTLGHIIEESSKKLDAHFLKKRTSKLDGSVIIEQERRQTCLT